MKILIDINHPADIHQFKNLRNHFIKKGNDIRIIARDKDVTFTLLKNLSIPFVSRGRGYNGILGKIFGLFKITKFIRREVIYFKPDIIIGGAGNVYISLVSKLTGIPSIIFDDTDHSTYAILFLKLFATCIITPSSYKKEIRKDQIRYNGYHELAYLHPKRFKVNPNILKELGIENEQNFVVIRFVSWNALHDRNSKGIDYETKKHLISYLSKFAKVFISSEADIPTEFKKYELKIPTEKIHDVLALAQLCIGEGATMASECAMLGTPAIYVNSLELGYCTEMEKKYNLIYNFRDSVGVLDKAIELINTPNLKLEWQNRLNKMLLDKIDVSPFMIWFVENYPASFKMMKKNPDYQYNFK